MVSCSSLSPSQRILWVRALYDFDAVEHDELGFRSGDIVEVLDSSNPSWWKGRLRGELGLFPANYVTPVLLWGCICAPEVHIRAAYLTWQGQRRSASSLVPRTFGGFGFVLIYWQLIFRDAGKKENPLKDFVSLFCMFMTERGARILDCWLKSCWILPAHHSFV